MSISTPPLALMEGGDELALRRRAASRVGAGISVIALLALSDDGARSYDHENAQARGARYPELRVYAGPVPRSHGRRYREARPGRLGPREGTVVTRG
jgi:hypothetical protein